MVQSHPLRALGGMLAVMVPLIVWGFASATPPAFGQEDPDIKIQTQQTPSVRPSQPHPPAAEKDKADVDVEVERDAQGNDRELKVDFDPKGFAEVLDVIRQMRMEILQLRRELAEARGDRPLMERRLGYRQDQPLRDGERAENRIDNRQQRRLQRLDNRGERQDQRLENRDDRQEERGDGNRIENRVERRDDRQDNRGERRDDRRDNREERRGDRRGGDAEAKVEVE